MRVMLAEVLLEKPSLLMLDEPTSHPGFTRHSVAGRVTCHGLVEGACIIVSHDRRFLSASINKIVESIGLSAQYVRW